MPRVAFESRTSVLQGENNAQHYRPVATTVQAYCRFVMVRVELVCSSGCCLHVVANLTGPLRVANCVCTFAVCFVLIRSVVCSVALLSVQIREIPCLSFFLIIHV
jgi:hypothetical protein